MKKIKGRLITIFLMIAMIITFVVVPAFANQSKLSSFIDVPQSEWFYDYVMCLANRGIVKGYGDTGEYRPYNLVIREHAAKMVARAAGLNYEGKRANFPDVDPEGEMSPYIAALVEKGAIQGFPDGSYRPLDNIKRSHAAKIVQIAFGLKPSTKAINIIDFPTHDPGLTEAIRILASNGVVKGYGSSNLFKPDDEINRAEFAKMLCIAIAVEAVQEAETLGTPAAINHAQAQVDRLSDTQDADTKKFLQGRLDALQDPGKPKYTVTFDANGGTTPKPTSKKVSYGATYGDLATTSREGYTFKGWFTEKTGGTEVKSTDTVRSAVTLYAQWAPANDTAYTVEHYQQNVEGEDYTKFDTETEQGTTGAETAAQANEYEGFSAKSFDQAAIAADGTTVVKIYYDRNLYTVTFDSAGGSAVPSMEEVRYGSALTAPTAPTKTGYDFDGWTPSLPETMPADNLILTAQWNARNDTAYTVEHYQQNVEGEDYTKFDTETEQGTTGAETAAQANEYEGFSAKSFDQAAIAADGTTVVKIYYDRNLYTVTFDSAGGSAVPSMEEVRYGSALTAPTAPTKTGYDFDGWTPSLPETMPADNLILTAQWNARNDTAYTVEHYQQNVEGEDYTKFDTETEQGTTGAETAAQANEYEGFSAKSFDQAAIAADGTTVVKIYYDRNLYTVTFDSAGGSAVPSMEEVRYGSALTAPTAPTKTGYDFDGWTPSLPETMPADNLILTAQWNARNDTAYTVEHYQQNVEGEDYTKFDTETEQGTTGAETAAQANEYEGFSAKSFDQAAIAADGTTVVKIYYDRNLYTVTFDSAGGSAVPSMEEVRYGSALTAPTAPTKTGYDFDGWTPSLPETMPADNLILTAQWNARNDTAYTVEHYQQNVEGEDYTKFDTETEQGTTGAETAAQANEYEGFSAKSFDQAAIAADGTTVVKIYYDRNLYTVTFDSAGGSAVPSMEEVRYGSALTAPTAPTKTGYDFDGWTPSLPETMPADNLILTAQWNARNDTAYTVEHYQQNVEGEDYTKFDTETEQGTTGAETAAQANEYEGFSAKSFDQAAIAADGTTVVKIYYDRNLYTVTFDSAGGSAVPSMEEVRYGSALTAPTAPTKTGYDFDGWTPSLPETMPADNLILTAQWNARNDTAYTVEHYQQNVEGEDYTKFDTETEQGTTGAETAAQANEYEGFSAKSFDQAAIAADGTTVVKIYYDRNLYTVTFDSAGGSAVPSMEEVRYGSALTAPTAPTKTGYDFDGWTPSLPETMPADNLILTAQWNARNDTAYTVEHYQQNVEGEDYTKFDTETEQGTTGAETAAQANEYEGFSAKSFDQAAIAADGTTVVKIYYDRNLYTVTFDSAGGSAVPSMEEVRYGSALTAPTAPTKTGYDFDGWTPSLPETMPADNLILTAQWNARNDTAYTVEHYQQNVEGEDYTKFDTETEQGTTGAETAAQANEYEGFSAKSFDQAAIAADGTTVVKIYYDRNLYTVTFDSAGGSAVPSMEEVRYGSALTAPTAPTKTGYDFDGWTPSLPETMPADNLILTAQWNARNDTAYTVEHYQQNVEGEDYTKFDTETEQGTTGAETAAQANEYEGFSAKSFDQAAIAADGTTVVKIYYDRNLYTVTFDSAGGSAVPSMEEVRYGSALTAPTAPTKTGYDFDGWTPSLPETMPADNLILTAQWNARNDTAYTVEHYQQNVEGEDYTKFDTETKTGTTGQQTNATSAGYLGFETPSIVQKVISGDGTTVVEIYYKLIWYDINYNSDGGINHPDNPPKYSVLTPTITLQPATKSGKKSFYWIDVDSKEVIEVIPLGSTGDLNLVASYKSTGSPLIYSFDGSGFILEHEPVPYSINQAFEDTTYGTLRVLKPVDGRYRIRVSEDNYYETFVNGVNLYAVDYSDDGIKEIVVDIFGDLHTLSDRVYPDSFVDANGYDWKAEVAEKGQIVRSPISDLENGKYVDSYVASFSRPEEMANTGKLLVSAKVTASLQNFTYWMQTKVDAPNNIWWIEKALLKLPSGTDSFADTLKMVKMGVEVWDGSKWIHQADFSAGAHFFEEFLIPVDLSQVPDDVEEIKIRLTAGASFFEIDQVCLDFSEDQKVSVTKMDMETALKNGTLDVTSMVTSETNGQRVKVQRGEYVDIYFTAPELGEGLTRGMVVDFTGYHHWGLESVENPEAENWDDLSYEQIIQEVLRIQPEAYDALGDLNFLIGITEIAHGLSLEEKVEQIYIAYVLPWIMKPQQ